MYYGIMMCSSERKTHTAVQEGSANIFVMWSVFKLVFSGSLVSLGAIVRFEHGRIYLLTFFLLLHEIF